MCKLNKTLYGLKKAPRVWFEKCTIVITYIGFLSSEDDLFSFVKTNCHSCILLLLYFDDMIIIFDGVDEVSDLKLHLAK